MKHIEERLRLFRAEEDLNQARLARKIAMEALPEHAAVEDAERHARQAEAALNDASDDTEFARCEACGWPLLDGEWGTSEDGVVSCLDDTVCLPRPVPATAASG